MFFKSPASVAGSISCPILLLLGEQDKRVPPSGMLILMISLLDGLRWSQYLKSRGNEINVLMYPKVGHALDSVDAEHDGFTQIITFFTDKLDIKPALIE